MTVTFDGLENRLIGRSENRPFAMGLLDSRGEPAEMLTIPGVLVPLWLAYSPSEVLCRVWYRAGKMEVHEPRAVYDGRGCVVLTLPRSTPDWVGHLYVDAKRDYVPIRFVRQYRHKVLSEHSIRYVSDKQVGWVPSQWVSKQYDSSGLLQVRTSVEITNYSINQPLAGDVFAVEFPRGTHVAHLDGQQKKYFIALGGGKRRETAAHFQASARQAGPAVPT